MEEDNRVNEAFLAVFCLGLLLFSPLLLDIFDGPQHLYDAATTVPAFVFGVPLLYFYLFVSWAVLIMLMALVIRRAGVANQRTASTTGPHGDNE